MNLRPSGYEPDELPGCSTPRQDKSTSDKIADHNAAPDKKQELKKSKIRVLEADGFRGTAVRGGPPDLHLARCVLLQAVLW